MDLEERVSRLEEIAEVLMAAAPEEDVKLFCLDKKKHAEEQIKQLKESKEVFDHQDDEYNKNKLDAIKSLMLAKAYRDYVKQKLAAGVKEEDLMSREEYTNQ